MAECRAEGLPEQIIDKTVRRYVQLTNATAEQADALIAEWSRE